MMKARTLILTGWGLYLISMILPFSMTVQGKYVAGWVWLLIEYLNIPLLGNINYLHPLSRISVMVALANTIVLLSPFFIRRPGYRYALFTASVIAAGFIVMAIYCEPGFVRYGAYIWCLAIVLLTWGSYTGTRQFRRV